VYAEADLNNQLDDARLPRGAGAIDDADALVQGPGAVVGPVLQGKVWVGPGEFKVFPDGGFYCVSEKA
jgi:hypothetical protein